MDRLLIDYLPPYMQEYREMSRIMTAEQPEFELAWVAGENALADPFVWDATENGVKRMESIIGLTPMDTDTLEERKFRIIAYINQSLPYTYRRLEQALTNLCGDDYEIDLDADKYRIEIKLGLSNRNNFQAVKDVLYKMIPANLEQYVTIKYNRHEMFKPKTHGEMAAYTHYQLRNEVFDNG